MRREQYFYDNDPSFANSPFNHEEALDLLRNLPKNLLKNRENLEHLLRRVVATALALRQTRVEFDSEIRHRSTVLPASGGATLSVNPEQAARFLSPEQLSKLFDRFAQERLSALDAAKRSADEKAALSDRVLLEINTALTDPTLDQSTRDVLQGILLGLERP